MKRKLLILLLICLPAAAFAEDRLILRDGREIVGTIVREDADRIVIQTERGRRVYKLTKVRDIVRGRELRQVDDVPEDFYELSPMAQHLLNARAENLLGRPQSMVDRLEAALEEGGGTEAERWRARWLLIDAYEQLARFDDARELLVQITKEGGGSDKLRAQAHLDIFDQNPGYKLERVNNKLARKFLPRKLYLRGKESNALADKELMRKALEEYANQILLNKEIGLRALKEELNVEETADALREMPAAGRIERFLPYRDLLKEVNESIGKAQAIIPGYADGYELDLVRTEAGHLEQVVGLLFGEVFAEYPENASYAYDPENGKLTKEGREQWRENCEEFLNNVRPLIEATEYVINRTTRFPRELQRVNQAMAETLDRLKRTREAITRKKDTRTHV